jgi:Rps23 Pro-64 3,4-dihydroxylase Tpa1-like proline 4-hydroxylase
MNKNKLIINVNNVFLFSKIFPENVATKVLNKFSINNNWKFIFQERNNHYKHVFKNNSVFLPSKKEKYLAKFYRSDTLRSDKFIINSIYKFVLPILSKKFKITFKNIDIRCHKFLKNNFLRAHFDNYTAKLAVTINLNKEWKWDWGGILNIPYGKKFENNLSIIPTWNSMSVLCSIKGRKESPHYVSAVQEFALKPRYTITIFLS